MQKDVHNPGRLPTADGLAAAAGSFPEKGLPPVHLWNPPFCGDLDMRIARDGTWFYLGTPIGRAPLVRLFSRILKREGGSYYLVTPVEKVGITVEDVPFLAVDFDVEDAGRTQRLVFTTSVGDRVVAGPEHAIRVAFDPAADAPSPYLHVRAGLEARIDRKSFYRLVEIATEAEVDGVPHLGLWSDGTFFPFQPSAGLEG